MDNAQFDAVFPIICTDLAKKIAMELRLSDEDALSELYSSRLYEMLEQEETKIWQYSTEMLFELFSEEKSSGKITFPQI